MNLYLAFKKACFSVAYMDVGEGREQEALSFTNFRNSSLLRAIRCLESDFFEYNLLRPELIRDSLSIKSAAPLNTCLYRRENHAT